MSVFSFFGQDRVAKTKIARFCQIKGRQSGGRGRPQLLKSLVHIFELHHDATNGVDNGTDAFDYTSSDEYSGLVLDVMMPGMDA